MGEERLPLALARRNLEREMANASGSVPRESRTGNMLLRLHEHPTQAIAACLHEYETALTARIDDIREDRDYVDEEPTTADQNIAFALRQRDGRVWLPEAAGLVDISENGVALVFAMRNPLVLEQTRQLIRSGSAEEAAPENTTSIARLASTIRSNVRRDTLSTLRVRLGEAKLALAMAGMSRPGRQRLSSEDIDLVARESHCSRIEIQRRRSRGAKLLRLCGGHLGLIPLVPLNRGFNYDAAEKAIYRIGDGEAGTVGRLLGDARGRSMCLLGSEVLSAIEGNGSAPGRRLRRLASSEWDFETMGEPELTALLRTWLTRQCSCSSAG